jgi:hypothetical protein
MYVCRGRPVCRPAKTARKTVDDTASTLRYNEDAVSSVRLSGKVLRGGSFNNNQNNARASYRNNNNPNNDNNNNGCRLVVAHNLPTLQRVISRRWFASKNGARLRIRTCGVGGKIAPNSLVCTLVVRHISNFGRNLDSLPLRSLYRIVVPTIPTCPYTCFSTFCTIFHRGTFF